VGLPRIGLTPAQRRAALPAALVALGCPLLTGDQADVRTRTRDRDNQSIYLYHYTESFNIIGIIARGLRASIPIVGNPRSDANFGPGQYLTDLTPSEASTGTMFQVSRALFNNPWHWGRRTRNDIVYLKIRVNGLFIQREATLFSQTFGVRWIYRVPNILNLQVASRLDAVGPVVFRPTPGDTQGSP
jgi:hypothetical protein